MIPSTPDHLSSSKVRIVVFRIALFKRTFVRSQLPLSPSTVLAVGLL